ncbi:Chloroperoxidase [Penicillium soppii]|uniref:Chloroperoxidase n=1 Tax=Penicillium soppii TaxID=69789 RepID=UPI002546CD30|nr:Chloroperoxidase [Penicillium soppii]KAJ5855615.1 Chloroperoxidase [Penicillium soppii]
MYLPFIKTVLFSLITISHARDPKGHEYHPALPTDSRSPCPGLNALANHAYLPRSGKNIDLATLRNAVHDAYNYIPTSFDGAFAQAVSFNLTTTGNASTFHLFDLARHDDIEFDGSLSRNDIYFGDDVHFDINVWTPVAHNLNLYDTLGPENNQYVTVETAARARAARVKEAQRVNPSFNASANQIMGSPGTTALYLTTLWDDNVSAAPKAWVRAFFEEERIPFLEGFGHSVIPRTEANFTEMTKRVLAVDV